MTYKHHLSINAYRNPDGDILCRKCSGTQLTAEQVDVLDAEGDYMDSTPYIQDQELQQWLIVPQWLVDDIALDNGYECPGDDPQDIVDEEGRCLECSYVACEQCGHELQNHGL